MCVCEFSRRVAATWITGRRLSAVIKKKGRNRTGVSAYKLELIRGRHPRRSAAQPPPQNDSVCFFSIKETAVFSACK